MTRWRNKADLSSRHCGWIMIALLCGEAHEKIDRFLSTWMMLLTLLCYTSIATALLSKSDYIIRRCFHAGRRTRKNGPYQAEKAHH